MNKEEMLNCIKVNKWYRQAGSTKAYYIFTCCKAAMDCIGAPLSFWFINNKKYLEGIFVEKDFDNCALRYLNEQKNDKTFIDKWLVESEERGMRLDSFYEKYLDYDFSKCSFEEINSLLQEFDNLNYQYWLKSYLCDAYDPNGTELLKAEMKRENLDWDEMMSDVFMRNNQLNYMQEERLSLLRLAKDFSEEALQQHAKKFFYIDSSWESVKVLGVEDFRQRMSEIESDKNGEQIKSILTDWEGEQSKLIEKYGISDSLVNVFYFFRQLFKIRDQRKRRTLLNNYFFDKFFLRLSEITGIPFEDFSVILVGEVSKGAEYLKKKIEERKSCLLEIYDNGSRSVLSGEEALEFFQALQKTFVHEEKSIKGTPACKGVVRGIVRVIFGEAHFSKFNDGEILVAPMTRPEFVPLMKKSLAIITDEGGITSHAAIVSRELGIPCVVGTKIATKILRDGDEVEVDADRGVINIIR